MAEHGQGRGLAARASEGAEGKYLSFSLAEEDYGIGILKVREIIGIMPVTPVPRTPEHVKGVINLRGKVIPVIDLRLWFGIPPAEYTDRTCIVVVEMAATAETGCIGVVVDAVSEVVAIKAAEIEPPPAFGGAVDTSCILGMAKKGGGVKILLDIDRVLSATDLQLVA